VIPDAHRAPVKPTLATAHIPALSIDVLVTIWADGTGELAYRDGPGQYGLTWSPPIPLVVAP
jgi:hypothetical protein